MPGELFESEFFGHRRAAFTGAPAIAPGRFELADGGTLFLDEVGEIPLQQVQVKLLRVLQEGEFERVGDEGRASVDVRIIAPPTAISSPRSPPAASAPTSTTGSACSRSTLPPLRDRREDIPLLAHHFLTL
jgi:transcriptional regulator with GAF, ATPase, and Fis domain